jgi:hypothetical protein
MNNNTFVFRVKGGLGSQMLAYATSFALQKERPDSLTFCDFSIYYQKIANRWGHILTPQLDYVFGIKELVFPLQALADGLSRKSAQGAPGDCMRIHRQGSNFNYDPGIFRQNGTVVFTNNSWLSWRYFEKYATEIAEIFSFRPIKPGLNSEIYSLIASKVSVGIHVRRNDFVASGQHVLGIDYYNRALDIVFSLSANPLFLIITDDQSWAREFIVPRLRESQFVFTNNTGLDSYIDMQLLAGCNIKIIANSSFSGWAAWLGHQALTICPNEWSPSPGFVEVDDMVHKNWLPLATL